MAIYALTATSDLLDGLLARRLSADTYAGRVLDLVSDKTLTIVSLLYAAARGITMVPLSLIAAREILSIGLRLVTPQAQPLLSTSRVFGGAAAIALWGNTLLLVSQPNGDAFPVILTVYWVSAVAYSCNLALRLHVAWPRLKEEIERDRGRAGPPGEP